MTEQREQLAQRMAAHALRELEANAWKGDEWLEADPEALDHEVIYHAFKLSIACRAGTRDAIRELAADVSNGAAMLADRHGVLDQDPPPPPGKDEEYDGGAGAIGSTELMAYAREVQGHLRHFRPRGDEHIADEP